MRLHDFKLKGWQRSDRLISVFCILVTMYKLLLLLSLCLACAARCDRGGAFGPLSFFCVQDCCKKVCGNLGQNHSSGRHVYTCNVGGIIWDQFTQCCRDLAPKWRLRDAADDDEIDWSQQVGLSSCDQNCLVRVLHKKNWIIVDSPFGVVGVVESVVNIMNNEQYSWTKINRVIYSW